MVTMLDRLRLSASLADEYRTAHAGLINAVERAHDALERGTIGEYESACNDARLLTEQIERIELELAVLRNFRPA